MLNPTLNPHLVHQLTDCLEQSIHNEQADFGNIQLYNAATDTLHIIAQKGFTYDFLDYFREVKPFDSSACGRALGSGNTVVIEDIQLEKYDDTFKRVALGAGYRAVKSVPVIAHDGRRLGIISTHHKQPRHHFNLMPPPSLPRLTRLLEELSA